VGLDFETVADKTAVLAIICFFDICDPNLAAADEEPIPGMATVASLPPYTVMFLMSS
jgi:hypothetical protein